MNNIHNNEFPFAHPSSFPRHDPFESSAAHSNIGTSSNHHPQMNNNNNNNSFGYYGSAAPSAASHSFPAPAPSYADLLQDDLIYSPTSSVTTQYSASGPSTTATAPFLLPTATAIPTSHIENRQGSFEEGYSATSMNGTTNTNAAYGYAYSSSANPTAPYEAAPTPFNNSNAHHHFADLSGADSNNVSNNANKVVHIPSSSVLLDDNNHIASNNTSNHRSNSDSYASFYTNTSTPTLDTFRVQQSTGTATTGSTTPRAVYVGPSQSAPSASYHPSHSSSSSFHQQQQHHHPTTDRYFRGRPVKAKNAHLPDQVLDFRAKRELRTQVATWTGGAVGLVVAGPLGAVAGAAGAYVSAKAVGKHREAKLKERCQTSSTDATHRSSTATGTSAAGPSNTSTTATMSQYHHPRTTYDYNDNDNTARQSAVGSSRFDDGNVAIHRAEVA